MGKPGAATASIVLVSCVAIFSSFSADSASTLSVASGNGKISLSRSANVCVTIGVLIDLVRSQIKIAAPHISVVDV